MKFPDEAWKENFIAELGEFALKGKYKEALTVTTRALKKYPNEFVCRYQHARILGDWADELPKAKRKEIKREAIRILKPLVRSLNGKPTAQRFSVSLNYYYQSELFKEMYRYGKRFAATDKRQGAYAQGLGAALLAQKLLDQNRPLLAKSWAKKSQRAWEKYGLKDEKYYFAHYAYAKALAVAGDKQKARKSLETAARVSKRKITDWEFADVLGLTR